MNTHTYVYHVMQPQHYSSGLNQVRFLPSDFMNDPLGKEDTSPKSSINNMSAGAYHRLSDGVAAIDHPIWSSE